MLHDRVQTYRLKSGEFRIFTTNYDLVNLGGQRHIIGTLQDITEHKQAMKNLHETTTYLENLINYANAPIIVWNPDLKIIKFNHAFEHLTGLKADEVVGGSLDILFPASSRRESLAFIQRTTNGEYWETVEIPILQTNGAIGRSFGTRPISVKKMGLRWWPL